MEASHLIRFFRSPGLHPAQHLDIRRKFEEFVAEEGLQPCALIDLRTEYCFHIETEEEGGSASLTERELQVLKWLLSETFEQQLFASASFLEVILNKRPFSVQLIPFLKQSK